MSALATKASSTSVRACSSPGVMPWSIASLARGGGASDAAVAKVSATNMRMTRPR